MEIWSQQTNSRPDMQTNDEKMSRGRERRELRKKETEELNARRQVISDADSKQDLLADLPTFRHFDRNGLVCDVFAHSTFPPEYRDWAFEIISRHMRHLYEGAWGWSDTKKRQELFGERSRYLIAVKDTRPIGFIHIRFEMEERESVLYVYELQIEDQYQRKGLGRFLMQAAEFISFKNGLDGVQLTVFIANAAARTMYQGMKYQPHWTSPELSGDPTAPSTYQILFKPTRKPKQ
jgi:ribosomal protein S18 acetylase RimI-like enzyme